MRNKLEMEVRNRLLTGNYCQIRYNNQQPIHKRENFHPLISNVNTRYTPQMFGVLPGKVNIAFKGS
jgi:hypothetical protein